VADLAASPLLEGVPPEKEQGAHPVGQFPVGANRELPVSRIESQLS
jgi:hypothetical protein